MAKKTKILFLAANPVDAGYKPRLDKELREIKAEIRRAEQRDLIDLESEWAVTTDDLHAYLLEHRPAVVHFSGHGSGDEGIILEDNEGRMKPIGNRALAGLFEILKDNIRIVILNACYSKIQIEAFAHTIDYTVGMSQPVEDKSAIVFSAAFYRALAYGRPVKQAFDLAVNQILLEGFAGSETPVLLIREGVDASVPFLKSKKSSRSL